MVLGWRGGARVGEDAGRGVDLPSDEGDGRVVGGGVVGRERQCALEEGLEEGGGVGLVRDDGAWVVHDEEDGSRVSDEGEVGGRECRAVVGCGVEERDE